MNLTVPFSAQLFPNPRLGFSASLPKHIMKKLLRILFPYMFSSKPGNNGLFNLQKRLQLFTCFFNDLKITKV